MATMVNWSADVDPENKVYCLLNHDDHRRGGGTVLPLVTPGTIRHLLSEVPSEDCLKAGGPWIYDPETNSVMCDPIRMARALYTEELNRLQDEEHRQRKMQAIANLVSNEELSLEVKAIISTIGES